MSIQMDSTLFHFLLTFACLADATPKEPCEGMEGIVRLEPGDCQAFWMCIYTPGVNKWIADRCEDGYIADEFQVCRLGTCKGTESQPGGGEVVVQKPQGVSTSFDCGAAGAAWGARGYGDPVDCRYYWWCWVVNGQWAPKVYKCSEGQMWKQHEEACWSGPCSYA